MRSASTLALIAMLASACGDSGNLKMQVATIKHPSGVEQTGARTAEGILGRGESVTSLQLKAAYKTTSISEYYQQQLREAGWNVCPNPNPTQWVEFIDKSSGVETEKAQLRIQFYKNDFDGEIRFEQGRPAVDASQVRSGVGYLRITTPASGQCASSK